MNWLTLILAILLVASIVYILVDRAAVVPPFTIPTDVLAGTSSTTQLYSTTTLTKSTNTIGVTIATGTSLATSLKVQFPDRISSGYYQVLVYFKASDTTLAFTSQNWALPSAFVNCQYYLPGTSLPVPPGRFLNIQNAPFSPITTSNSGMMQLIYIAVTGAAPSFEVNVSGPLTANTTWTIYVTAADHAVANLLT